VENKNTGQLANLGLSKSRSRRQASQTIAHTYAPMNGQVDAAERTSSGGTKCWLQNTNTKKHHTAMQRLQYTTPKESNNISIMITNHLHSGLENANSTFTKDHIQTL